MPRARLLHIGPLTNLQDARASAAWGADYLSFALERGALHKVNALTLKSILEWLAGPLPVLALGADVEQASALLAQDWGGSLALELDAPTWPLAPALPDHAHLAWRVTPDDITRAPDGLMALLRSAAYVQLVVPAGVGAALPGLLRQLRAALGPTPLLLRADGLPQEALDRALDATSPLVDGLSLGPTQAQDFTQLDYDAVERVLERYRGE